MTICYSVSDTQHVTDVFFTFHFGLKIKTFKKLKKKKKKKKNPEDIIILHLCTKNYDHMMYGS